MGAGDNGDATLSGRRLLPRLRPLSPPWSSTPPNTDRRSALVAKRKRFSDSSSLNLSSRPVGRPLSRNSMFTVAPDVASTFMSSWDGIRRFVLRSASRMLGTMVEGRMRLGEYDTRSERAPT